MQRSREPFHAASRVDRHGGCGGLARPASHTVRFVTAPGGVRLEVLDWGGTGEPLVFLAGLEDAAHMFDDFAPRFTDQVPRHWDHATRLGGIGSADTNYSIATLVADVHAVLDSLHLTRVDLAGHSIAGQGSPASQPGIPTTSTSWSTWMPHSTITRTQGAFLPGPTAAHGGRFRIPGRGTRLRAARGRCAISGGGLPRDGAVRQQRS